jgi:hypothetical protein
MLRIGKQKGARVKPLWQKVGCLTGLEIPHETRQELTVLGAALGEIDVEKR